jgi:arsenate reductase (glutaredoxin)
MSISALWHEWDSACNACACYNPALFLFLPETVMSEFTIYHNPRCSKSRNTLALLQEKGIEPEVVLYLENTPDAGQLQALLTMLDKTAGDIVRRSEEAYKACGLSKDSSEEALIAAMVAHPKLIERPIVVHDGRAVLGRPPENVLELID